MDTNEEVGKARDGLEAALQEAGEWAAATFVNETALSKAHHLVREAEELVRNPSDPREIADCAILVGGIARLGGVDLAAAVRAKLAELRTRTWGEPDALGVVQHVSTFTPGRVYVAGRFQSYEMVRACIDAVKALGWTVTHDWTRTPAFGPDGHPLAGDGTQPKAVLREHADNDRQGVRDADLVIVLADDSLAGAWVEMGIALERRTPVWVIAPERWTIFLECDEVTTWSTVDEALNALELGWTPGASMAEATHA